MSSININHKTQQPQNNIVQPLLNNNNKKRQQYLPTTVDNKVVPQEPIIVGYSLFEINVPAMLNESPLKFQLKGISLTDEMFNVLNPYQISNENQVTKSDGTQELNTRMYFISLLIILVQLLVAFSSDSSLNNFMVIGDQLNFDQKVDQFCYYNYQLSPSHDNMVAIYSPVDLLVKYGLQPQEEISNLKNLDVDLHINLVMLLRDVLNILVHHQYLIN